jgi:type I restriction enzyme S subunit
MKISLSDYIKKVSASVLVAEAVFQVLYEEYPYKKISEIAKTASGGTPLRNNSDYYGGDIPWLKSGELNDGFIDNAEEFITETGLNNSSAKLNPKGTLLLAMYGATAGKVGVLNINACTNQAVCALYPKDGVYRDYLYWFLRQHRYRFIEISKGGAQPNISQTVIKKTLIPVPDIELQHSVSHFLNTIDKEERLEISQIPEKFRNRVASVFN